MALWEWPLSLSKVSRVFTSFVLDAPIPNLTKWTFWYLVFGNSLTVWSCAYTSHPETHTQRLTECHLSPELVYCSTFWCHCLLKGGIMTNPKCVNKTVPFFCEVILADILVTIPIIMPPIPSSLAQAYNFITPRLNSHHGTTRLTLPYQILNKC